ncbi:GNAT family N-acetyltransferase [Arthrobacter sp. zg-Y769]|uniref:GNAT family N-acetyltransferase n=1 Tax=Arthrobacter sp. zg-Y769 TaxID=2894191 RepID=UPI002F421095
MPGFIPTPPPIRVPGPMPFTGAGQQATTAALPLIPDIRDTRPTVRGGKAGPPLEAHRVSVLRDDPGKADVRALLAENRDLLYPAGTVAAGLTPPSLRDPSVTFWTVREDGALLGCGALKELAAAPGGAGGYGEITSMRTVEAARGRGVAQLLLQQIITNARARGYAALLLETGTQEFFASSRRLYQRHGFTACPPFGNYRADPSSTFMRLNLQATAPAQAAAAAVPDAAVPDATPAGKVYAKPGTLTEILAAQRALASAPIPNPRRRR